MRFHFMTISFCLPLIRFVVTLYRLLVPESRSECCLNHSVSDQWFWGKRQSAKGRPGSVMYRSPSSPKLKWVYVVPRTRTCSASACKGVPIFLFTDLIV